MEDRRQSENRPWFIRIEQTRVNVAAISEVSVYNDGRALISLNSAGEVREISIPAPEGTRLEAFIDQYVGITLELDSDAQMIMLDEIECGATSSNQS